MSNLPQNLPGSTILLKSDNGQYQLLRISTAQPGQQGTPGLTQSGNTIRLQTVPAVSRFTGPPLAIRKTILTQQVKQKQNVKVFLQIFFLFLFSYNFRRRIFSFLFLISASICLLFYFLDNVKEHENSFYNVFKNVE